MTESDAGTVGEADYSDPFSTYHHPTMLRPPLAVQYDSDPQAEQKEWDLSVKYVSSLLEELRVMNSFHAGKMHGMMIDLYEEVCDFVYRYRLHDDE